MSLPRDEWAAAKLSINRRKAPGRFEEHTDLPKPCFTADPIHPAITALPSFCTIPNAMRVRTAAGTMPVKGMGRKSRIDSTRQSNPVILSPTNENREGRLGESTRSMRPNHGTSLAIAAAIHSFGKVKPARAAGSRTEAKPSASWAETMMSGIAKTVETPGGNGRMFGAANMSMSAPKLRSRKNVSRSCILRSPFRRARRTRSTSENDFSPGPCEELPASRANGAASQSDIPCAA